MDTNMDIEESCERAWRRFRARLADRVAGFEEGQLLVVTVRTGIDETDLAGCAPQIEIGDWSDGRFVAEVVGNAYLDERFALSEADELALLRLGWEPPDDPAGTEPTIDTFHLWSTYEYVDRVAALAVAALREVHRVPHPLFLDAEGLEADDDWTEPAPSAPEPVTEQPLVMVFDEEHLQRLLDAALEVMFTEPAEHDDDGDLPITCGLSRAFVRVMEDRPAVEIYAFAVVELTDTDAALAEASRLNEATPDMQWYVDEDMLMARRVVLAQPFVASHVREAVARFCEHLDDAARAAARRTGGRAFLARPLPPRPVRDRTAQPALPEGASRDDAHPAMVELLEMLHVDDVPVLTVASVFAHHRRELVRQIVRVRTGVQPLDGLDEERVLRHLRRALRLLADRQARAERRPEPPERRPVTRQLSLLSDEELGEDTLGSGWGA